MTRSLFLNKVMQTSNADVKFWKERVNRYAKQRTRDEKIEDILEILHKKKKCNISQLYTKKRLYHHCFNVVEFLEQQGHILITRKGDNKWYKDVEITDKGLAYYYKIKQEG